MATETETDGGDSGAVEEKDGKETVEEAARAVERRCGITLRPHEIDE